MTAKHISELAELRELPNPSLEKILDNRRRPMTLIDWVSIYQRFDMGIAGTAAEALRADQEIRLWLDARSSELEKAVAVEV